MQIPTVLLTGATGFIGGCVLGKLIEARPDCRVLLFARHQGAQSAAQRLRRSLERFIGGEQAEATLRSCEIITGDLTDSSSLANPRLDEVTHVLHVASNTSMRSVRTVRHTNVLGALSLAHRMRRVAGLKRFLYVGTAYICGQSSESLVHEDMFPRLDARHFTEYTASKAECEMLLRATAPELPLVVARPSVVIGHTLLGCVPSSSIFWFYRACDLLRRVTCPLDSRDDVVPADWVADALLFLLFKEKLSHDCYHLSAGEGSSITWSEIASVFEQCHGERADNPYRVVEIPTIVQERGRMEHLLGPGDMDHLLTVMQIFYRFMEIDAEIFDNTRLLQEGVPPPPRFTEYLYLCATRPADRSVYQQMLDDI